MADEKERAARASLAVSAALAAAKLAAALASGSLALLSDALQSLLDIGATAMTLLAVRYAAKPADEDHPYGHGKIESVTALVEVGLLLAVSAWVVVEAIGRLRGGAHAVEATPLVVAVLLVAIAVDFFRARQLRRVAAETESHALESNALHFAADMWQSVVVLAGFGLVAAGVPQGDALAAIVVSGLVAWTAVGLGRRTVDALMDAAPGGVADEVRGIAQGVRGVVDVRRVRLRKVGAQLIGEITVEVGRASSSERMAEIARSVELAVEAAVPGADIVVRTAARQLDDESVLERVLVIAARRRIPVHHVTAQQIAGKLAIALDVEVDGRMSLEAAHVIASRIENDIRDEFGAEVEVETHIEPLDAKGLPGREVDEGERAAVARVIAGLGEASADLGDIHDVRVRETEKGRLVVLHCRADPKLTVAAVHAAVDEFERAIKAACPGVVRVVTHAEPRR
jgi:cation diffusion facilitator family transporter